MVASDCRRGGLSRDEAAPFLGRPSAPPQTSSPEEAMAPTTTLASQTTILCMSKKTGDPSAPLSPLKMLVMVMKRRGSFGRGWLSM